MARTKSIDLRSRFRQLLSPHRASRLAREAGWKQRDGKIKPFAFIWTLVLGFGAGRERDVSSLRRSFKLVSGVSLVPSSFYERFTPSLVTLLLRVVAHFLTVAVGGNAVLGGSLAGFKDVMLADASVLRLRRRLEHLFPACRTNHTKAAAKLHAVMSVTGAGHQAISITGERVNDRRRLKIGEWVRDRLLLVDLGYFGYRLFDRIRANGGFFISRLKTNANPLIVAEHGRSCGRARKLVGRRLQDVLAGLRRRTIDVEIEVDFMRRAYGGKPSRAKTRFRLVGVFNAERKEHHLYVTNVPLERLSAEEVALAYRARWEIELLFKAWKSEFGLDELPSRNPDVVEALILASVITMLVSRRLHALLRARAGPRARRVTAGRVAVLVRECARDLLLVIARARRDPLLERDVVRLLDHEAVAPHVHRSGLLECASGVLAGAI